MSEVTDSQTNKKMNFKSLLIENVKYRTLFTEKYKQRKAYSKKNEGLITAFIPGTILNIYVKPKKKVKEGDKLLVLEAMKMKNDLLAPVSGIIKSINVSVGDRVSKEDILIEIG